MKCLKTFGMSLVSAVAVGVMIAPAAFGLPDVSLTLSGSAFPLHLEVTLLTAKTNLSSASGAVADGEGLLLLSLTNQSEAARVLQSVIHQG